MSTTSHDKARAATYLSGALIAAFVISAAAWLVARDYRSTLENAEQHLENFTIVLAEQTALALRTAPDVPAAGEASSVEQEAFQKHMASFYGALEISYSGRLALFDRDGTLRAVVPRSAGLVGRNYADRPLFTTALPREPAGTFEGRGIVDPSDRLIAYRTVKAHPMVVVISSPMSEVLERWQRDSMLVGLGALLLACLTAAASYLLDRQLKVSEGLTRDLSESEARLNSIIGSAMDAMITVDEKQQIVLFNNAAERIFGCAAATAIGSPLEVLIPERFREAHAAHVERFSQAGVTMRRMGGDLVLSGRRLTGEEFPIDASISYALVAGRKYYTVILRDITERQQALQEQERARLELEETGSRFKSIIDSAMDAIITIDESQKIVLFNVTAERTFECSSADAIGSNIERFIPERYRARHREHVARFGEAGVTARRMGTELILAGRRSDGEEFPIDASISHVTVGGRKLYTVILRDITERQRAAAALSKSHQDLRDLYESMHQVREAERTRIARELHDELAQWLTALKMDAVWIAGRPREEHDHVVTRATRMKSVIDSTVAAVRRIASDLRPVMLDDLGLVPALENLVNDLAARTGIAVEFRAQGDEGALGEPLATAIYRMVQEALTNVARHASASTVAVQIRTDEKTLHVRIQDDGIGLRPDPNRKSFGLLGIQERARTLGGDARIYSPETGGTVVEIDIPLESHASAGVPA